MLEKKDTVRNIPSSDGISRFVVSKEIRSDTRPSESEIEGQTYRLRYIYKDWNSGVLLNVDTPAISDLHITFRTENMRQSLSIEIELPSEYPESVRNQIVKKVMEMHNGWDVPNFPTTFGAMKRLLSDYEIRSPGDLQKPIDISWNDLQYNQMITNPHAISFKADGQRMILVFSDKGTFFVSSSLYILPINLQSSGGGATILDAERVGDTLWIFDLLFLDGDDYRYSPLTERLAAATTVLAERGNILSVPGSEDVQMRMKPIRIPSTAQEFFTAVQETLNEVRREGIPFDGLIFTGANQPYMNNVLKWKPLKQLSVDFFIGSGNPVTLNTYVSGEMKPHPEFLVDGDVSDHIGRVGEFLSDDGETWKLYRIRDDKSLPNSENVLQAILRLMKDPITEDVITGQSFSLMRKYHNRVKRAVYDLLGKTGVGTLTDIGSAKGGDLSSWERNFLSVNAVEPNSNNVRELLSRAASMGENITITQDKPINGVPTTTIQGENWDASVYNTDAEGYLDRIRPFAPVSALTLFNSATFLGPEVLSRLSDEVRDDGVIVILVIDGKVLLEEFLPSGERSYTSNLLSIQRIPCTLKETFGNLGCISIRITDSATVSEEQNEGLVDVDVLLASLREYEWIPDIDMFLTQEKLLGEEEAKYSAAQRLIILRKAVITGSIIRKRYPILPSGVEEIIPGINEDIAGSPWGTVVRVGNLGDNLDQSFFHALLQATNKRYKSSNDISKTMIAIGTSIRQVLSTIKVPIYIILSDSWNIITSPSPERIEVYSPLEPPRSRTPGIVLMENNNHWEPLAKKTMTDELSYIW